MPIPKNKTELIEAITINYESLSKEIINIPTKYTDKKELEGHAKNTLISINNLLAYLIGWGELVIKWDNKKNNHIPIDFPETGYKWNELGQLAQKFYKDYENYNHEKLITKLDETVLTILDIINHKTNYELYETYWYNTWTLGRMIQLNTSSPYKNAKNRIRKWKKSTFLK